MEKMTGIITKLQIIFLSLCILMLRCECPLQCCPENTIIEVSVSVNVADAKCIPGCNSLRPYFTCKDRKLYMSSDAEKCGWLTNSLSQYIDSMLSLCISINDTAFVLIDSLFVHEGDIKLFEISVNGKDPEFIDKAYVSCEYDVDSIRIRETKGKCNACGN